MPLFWFRSGRAAQEIVEDTRFEGRGRFIEPFPGFVVSVALISIVATLMSLAAI